MRYISDSVISFSLQIEGRAESVRISFQSHSMGGSTYSTQSEAIIKALEGSRMYGKHYRRAPECANEVVSGKKKKAVKAPKVKEVPEVEGWQDAAEYLSENFGVDMGKLNTPDDIVKEASLRYLKFTNLE